MPDKPINPTLKKGSAEMLVLSLVEVRDRHGYQICKCIEQQSGGDLRFNVASFYPLLYRLEERGLIAGRWVEKPSQRRRRFYKITRDGRKALAQHRRSFENFVNAVTRILRAENA
jgi:PadR family transcriptional regulator PadR